MLFNLLLASIKILFLAVFNPFFINPVVKENTKVKLALVNPAGIPITLAKEIIDTPSLVSDKTIKVLSI